MEIYRPLLKETILETDAKAEGIILALIKELVAILATSNHPEVTTKIIDGAINCISAWLEFIIFSSELTKCVAHIYFTKGEEMILENCCSDFLFLNSQYERLKANTNFYDTKNRISPDIMDTDSSRMDSVRQNVYASSQYTSIKTNKDFYDAKFRILQEGMGSYRSCEDYLKRNTKCLENSRYYDYCIEFKDILLSEEEILKLLSALPSDVLYHTYRADRAFIRDENNIYHVHTFVDIVFKSIILLPKLKELFPNAKIHHGTDGYWTYQKYLTPDFALSYYPRLYGRTSCIDITRGLDFFSEKYPTPII